MKNTMTAASHASPARKTRTTMTALAVALGTLLALAPDSRAQQPWRLDGPFVFTVPG